MSINTKGPKGVLLVDKPAGITSYDVIRHVKQVGLPSAVPSRSLARRGEARRAKLGHAGTLDPFATGLLIIAVGTATRLLEYTHGWDKTYQATVTLAGDSDTDDLTGNITPQPTRETPNEARVKEVLQSFTGPQQQIPPRYAAIKVKGKKLYEYARAGDTVERKARPVTIHSITMQSYHYPLLRISVRCSTGTYIRALARDIGEKLGTGGYLTSLRRTKIGTYSISEAIPLNELTQENLQQHLLPPEVLVQHLPSVTLSDANVAQLKKGQAAEQSSTVPPNKPIALFDQQNNLIGIGTYDPSTSLLSPNKIVA